MTNSVFVEPAVPTSRFGRKYAWRRDVPDQRDMVFSAPLHAALPDHVDLSALCGHIEDQGNLGSCTAHALGTCLEFITTKNRDLSRLFIYYNERAVEGDIMSDNGAMIRTGAKVCSKYGSPVETYWPYNIHSFNHKPPPVAYQEGVKHKALSYQSIVGLQAMKACLAQGFPFAAGISVYDSFESDAVAQTGIVPMPKSTESLLGGHAIAVVGYNDAKQMFLVRNSWGTLWGLKGYFWIPYAYLGNTSLASDHWTLR